MIAGLLRPGAGRIALGGRTLFDSAAGIDVPSSSIAEPRASSARIRPRYPWDFVTSAVSPGVEAAPEKGLYDPGDEHGKTRSTSVNRWIVHDVDFESGRIRWSKEVVAKIPAIGRHIKNSFASETATTDGERVYVYFGAIGLIAALDFDGRIVWTRQVPAHETYFDMGTAASPVLHKDRLYIVHDNLTESFMVALDKRSGAQVWRVARRFGRSWPTGVR